MLAGTGDRGRIEVSPRSARWLGRVVAASLLLLAQPLRAATVDDRSTLEAFFAAYRADLARYAPDEFGPLPLEDAWFEKPELLFPYVIERDILSGTAFTMSAPIWTEALLDDGLFDLDAMATGESTKSLTGFVVLELDYGLFHENLVKRLKTAIMVLVALLLATVIVGRRYLLRYLRRRRS